MRRSSYSALLAFALFCNGEKAQAQDDFVDWDDLEAELSGAGAGPVESGSLREVSGFVAEESRFFVTDRGKGKNDEQLITETQLELSLGLGGQLFLEATPWIFVDALDSELVRYEPLEAYATYRGEGWDLLGGQFRESWGIADTSNPLDVLNRRDLGVDLFDPESRGELGLRARWTLPGGDTIGEPTFGIYAIPLWRDTELPTENSRFSFSQGPAALALDDTSGPDGINRLLAGIRYDSTLSTDLVSADVQLLAVRGPSRNPLVAPLPHADGTTSLVPQYFGEWVLGGGLRAVPEADWWSKLTLKAEFAYKRPYVFSRFSGPGRADLNQKPDDYFQFVAGFDRSFPNLFTGQDELTMTLEYAGEVGADDAANLLRPFDSDVALRLAWSAGDFARSALELRGIFDVRNSEGILEAVAVRQLRFLHDDLKMELSGRWLRASEREDAGLFSVFPTNNSQVAGRLQFDF